MNPRRIAHNHTWMKEFWVCVIPCQKGSTYHGSDTLISGVNILGTHLSHTLEFGNYSCMVVLTVSIGRPVYSQCWFFFQAPSDGRSDIFFKTLRYITTGTVLVFNALPFCFELTYPSCDCRITQNRPAINIVQALMDIRCALTFLWDKPYRGPVLYSLHFDEMVDFSFLT